MSWPTAPGGVRPPVDDRSPVQRRVAGFSARPPALPLVRLLENVSLADALDEGAPDGSLPYLELLADVLEDGVLTDDERAALVDVASLYELDGDAVAAAHRGFLLALAHLALDDGRVSRAEKAELTATAALLDVPAKELDAVLDAAEAARLARLSAGLKPLPADWTLGEPLRVGDKVAFTGDLEHGRQQLEQRAQQLGVRVMGNVSRRTTLLVTDGRNVGSKFDVAAVHGTRSAPSDEFAILLDHLQPAARTATGSIPRPRVEPPPLTAPAEAGTLPDAHISVSPAAVRAWARANGFAIGDRGRLPLEVLDAYRRAHGVRVGH